MPAGRQRHLYIWWAHLRLAHRDHPAWWAGCVRGNCTGSIAFRSTTSALWADQPPSGRVLPPNSEAAASPSRHLDGRARASSRTGRRYGYTPRRPPYDYRYGDAVHDDRNNHVTASSHPEVAWPKPLLPVLVAQRTSFAYRQPGISHGDTQVTASSIPSRCAGKTIRVGGSRAVKRAHIQWQSSALGLMAGAIRAPTSLSPRTKSTEAISDENAAPDPLLPRGPRPEAAPPPAERNPGHAREPSVRTPAADGEGVECPAFRGETADPTLNREPAGLEVGTGSCGQGGRDQLLQPGDDPVGQKSRDAQPASILYLGRGRKTAPSSLSEGMPMLRLQS